MTIVKVGGAWKKKNRKGIAVLSVQVDLAKISPRPEGKLNLQIYPNKFKKEEKHPDYNVVYVTKTGLNVPTEKIESGDDF
jgi:uncharacterized protein (DUF736 family)